MKQPEYKYKVSAAGRVNLIGEHVDYCGGKVLPCALSLKSTVYVRPNGTNVINVAWTDLDEKVTLEIDKLDTYKTHKHAKYLAGCAYFWQQAGHKLVGCDLLLDCSVPFGSGLSSSAAIEVSTIVALAVVAGEKYDPVSVALIAQRAEHEYAGVNCGIMDQFASANGKAGHAVLLDCATLHYEYVPLDLKDCVLVLANCNKPHNLVESKYNERRGEVETALKHLQRKLSVENLAQVKPYQVEEYRTLLGATVYRRARHVVTECERVQKSVTALKEGDLIGFGQLLNESHISLRDDYEVTGKELDTLAEAAWERPECLGSRMTGAGFGGCTVNLVKKSGVQDFIAAVGEKYLAKIGYAASFYVAEIADGITEETL